MCVWWGKSSGRLRGENNADDKLAKKRLKESPEEIPFPGEIEAIQEGRKDRTENDTIPHESINRD